MKWSVLFPCLLMASAPAFAEVPHQGPVALSVFFISSFLLVLLALYGASERGDLGEIKRLQGQRFVTIFTLGLPFAAILAFLALLL